MQNKLSESAIEELAINLFTQLGYKYIPGPSFAPDGMYPERETLSDVILINRLKSAIDRINPDIPRPAKDDAIRKILNQSSQNLTANNERFHRYLTDGIAVSYLSEQGERGDNVYLIDYDNIQNNEFIVSNQFTVIENNINKRLDIVLFVNGIPLVVMELKNPVDEKATIDKAFIQLQNYKRAIPSLFNYNSILVASDGFDARAGTISSQFSRFSAWKTIEGKKEEKATKNQIETLIKGMLNKEVLLDLIRHFIVFEKGKKEDPKTGLSTIVNIKKIAAYHQYYAVKKAVESTRLSSSETGDRKAGVIWHTQGSGKSLSMVFYASKIVLALDNPTIVVLTDRNDLDNQLFDTFANCKRSLRQDPIQAENREHLKELLSVASGGIVFTTIQKFYPENNRSVYDLLSDRKNIVVIADEAHRSHYGFKARVVFDKDDENNEVNSRIVYGFAKYIRDALPNATFIGFTGTPIELEDKSTPAVFGNYIDIYDIAQAIEDGATVRIYYESRLVNVHLKPDQKDKIDDEVEAINEKEETSAKEQAKIKWAQLEAIVGHPKRAETIAKDIIEHFEKRLEVLDGKAMIVCMSRRIAVQLYDELIKIRPQWHSDDKQKGKIKVVMTSSSSDPESYQKHYTNKKDRDKLGNRFKNPSDELNIVIVCDMWLTGFDVPCLHTMYVDKPMRGHNLMQAIARVNRVYKDKTGGLIVDYIGIASDLKKAISTYTESGGRGIPVLDRKDAVKEMLKRFEIVSQMFDKFDYRKYFRVPMNNKLNIILEAQEYILAKKLKDRFVKEVLPLSKVFALSIPDPKALEIKDDVGFFQAIKARLTKFEPSIKSKSNVEIETAIKQIVDKAITSDGVLDIYSAAGIKKPDITILSDEFLEEIRGMKRRNIALELLKKIIGDEIITRGRKNFIQKNKLSELLNNSINRYKNNLLTTKDIIDELIGMAKDIRHLDEQNKQLNLSDEEIAFYDALANNESARDVMGDDTLRHLSRILVEKVRKNTKNSIDWTLKENVRAKLRILVKRTLRKYGYPPDEQKLATENVLRQAELRAEII